MTLTKEQKAELKSLQNEYIITKARLETIKQISKSNELKVLSENKFYDDEGKRILDDADFIEDLNEYEKFLNLLFKENKKSGLPVDDPNLVPEWREAKEIRKLKKQLFEFQLKITPKNIRDDIKKAQQHWKYGEQCLDLILRLA